jgi:CRISPR system Cascade subunit CasC
MSQFLQLHLLTFYPPSNLNRDDLGRPKSASIGGVNRLRISSQALKRTWRVSAPFQAALEGHLGERTQRLGRNISLSLKTQHNVTQEESEKIARVLASVFGKLDDNPKPGQELFIKQLAFISPSEMNKLNVYLEKTLADEELRKALLLAADEVSLEPEGAPEEEVDDNEDVKSKGKKKKKKQSEKTTKLLKAIREEIMTVADAAADIGMFGRMLADAPKFNREAAVQVAHAFTTHKVSIEDDYYTAVDDLKLSSEDAGAGFLGEAGFGAGVFYIYICIDRALLTKNLGGDVQLAGAACAALVEAAATISPGGKQASFASRARAHFVLAESGNAQPRTLASAFLKPVTGLDGDGNMLEASIKNLQDVRTAMDKAYNQCWEKDELLNVLTGEGSLEAIKTFCQDFT